MIALFKRSIGERTFPFRRGMSTGSSFQPPCDPFRYTQGRWLDRDGERRDARHVRFDFDALMNVAIKSSPGARHVIGCEKLEGGFNRVFMIHLDNQNTVVARLPTRLAGPPSLGLSSEVATLRFVKENTTIPVPRVLAWDAKSRNVVGTEYMIQEVMPGVPLKDVWNNMTASQHVACIRSIGRLCKQMCQLTFPAYGSLYFNTNAPPGVVELDEIFCVGPVCGPQHWGCGIDVTAATKPPNRHQGSWRNMRSYFYDLVARARADLSITSEQPGSAHLELLGMLQQTLEILMTLEPIKTASGPTLFHPDLHTRNIFVDSEDHTKITGIIDWQSAAVEPAFVFASDTPDFAQELDDEEDYGDITDEEAAANAKLRADVDFCVKTWVVMQQACEKLRPASRLDPVLLRVLAAPSFGWTDKEIIIETLLENLAKIWSQLGLPGDSIYQPCKPGFLEQRLDDYQATRRVQNHLTRFLRCDNDGWVSSDRWEEVLPLYRAEYSRFVEAVVESEECKNEEDKAKAIERANHLWPYDQR